MLIQNILVAVDGSENANRALDFALELAEKFDSALVVLNVSEVLAMGVIPQESTTYSFENMVILGKDLRKIHEEIISKAVSHANAVKPNLVISSILRDGDPATEIVSVAKDNGFDAIVIGHRGSSIARERVLGSISEKVAHMAPCPVVIVK
jgi:nucleotide-binding universal stress UspA family protein